MSKRSNSVLQHYKTLSGVYAKHANNHANERYRIECLSWLNGLDPVLDVGCGTAHFLSSLRPNLDIYGTDVSYSMLSSGPGIGIVTESIAEQLPFADETFGGVICINVLEHLEEPKIVLAELNRILKNGGRLILVTPAAEWSLLLDIAEILHLKLPEGPHQFLSEKNISDLITNTDLRPLVFRQILPLPIGNKSWVQMGSRFEKLFPSGFQHFLVALRDLRELEEK
jgi:2-polyprenyl-3-methyl-5-hydroxy-6-metoxy-1,4-benzoquinol methylase